MHTRFLTFALIVVIALGMLPLAAAAQPMTMNPPQAIASAPSGQQPAAPAPAAEAQRPRPERQAPSHVRELSAEELAAAESLSAEEFVGRYGYLPHALNQQTAGQKMMLVIELEQAPLAVHAAQQQAAGALPTVSDSQSYVQGLEATQAKVQQQLEGLGVQVISNYTTVYNGFLANVPLEQVNAIRELPGVTNVYRAPKHTPTLSSSVPLIGAPKVWDKLGYDGGGTVIAIIDTGIDYTHAALGGSGDPDDYADNNPDVVEPGSFPTAKVVAGYDFAGTDYNADDDVPIILPDNDPLDEAGHGSHVASIAAGNAAGQVSNGVAPGAKLMALKVFGADGTTNLVMDALDMAAFHYMLYGWPQVINMSLGSSYSPGDVDDPDVVATNNAVSVGIVVATSAGNSDNLYYVAGAPGNADKAVSTAASEDGFAVLDGFEVTTPASLAGVQPGLESVAYDWNSPDLPITGKLVYPEVGGNPAQNQRTGCYPFNDANKALINGNVVLLNWSTPSCGGSVARTANAVAAGAIGVLIVDDSSVFDLAITGSAVVPAYSIPQPIGDALKTALGAGEVEVVMTNEYKGAVPYSEPVAKDVIASFSSRGPRGTDSRLKPEITAPGGSIFAAAMGSGDGGTSMNGTSMAAPHIAGVAALMVQAHPDWTPEQIKAAMMNTAVDLLDGSPIPRQGAGRVDAYRAANTPVVAVGDSDLVSISGFFASNQDNYVITRAVTLYNSDTVAHKFNVDWDYQGASLTGVEVTLSKDPVIVGPGASETVNATFTFDMTALPADMGKLEEVYGYITFTPPPPFKLYLPLVMGGDVMSAAGIQPQRLMLPQDALRVPFYFVPRPYNELEITGQTEIKDTATEEATFEITQSGPIASSLWTFPLMVSDPEETSMPGDVKAVGVDYGWNAAQYGPVLAFAINAWQPWHLPSYYFAEFDVYVDSNEDGTDDYVIYNAPVAGTNYFVPRIINLKTGAGTSSPYAIYVDYNSGYMEFYVPASSLGLSGANSTFDFQVIGWDYYGTPDVTTPGRFDYARYPFGWDADTLTPGPGDPEATIEVWVNDVAGYEYSRPKGVMIVDYTGNPYDGGETYLQDITVTTPLDLTLLHSNDFHARVDEFDVSGAACTIASNCIGGSSRLATLVDGLRAETSNVLLVDAGDQFQGTLYYNLFKSEVIAKMMNAVGYDAMTVGNHEFDDGPAELAMLAARVDFPIVSTNLDVSSEPTLVGRLVPYTIVERDGEDIAILGVTTTELPDISSPGPNVVVENPATSVQATVDELKGQGIDKVVLLSHLGYDVDKTLAAAVNGVDVIVGGHTHSFLYDPATAQTFASPTLALTPVGTYPTVVESPTNEPVLIVTAFEWGKFLGRLDVTFNGYGIVTAYDGNPIYVNNPVAKDPDIETLLAPYRAAVNALMTLKVGEITVDAPLSVAGKRICRLGECLLGNLVTDAMLWQVNTVGGGDYQMAVTNGGGLRAPLQAGDVTYGGVMNVLPFGNTIATMGLKGADLLAALEHSVRLYPAENGGFLQVSGMRYTFNPALPAGSRIVSAEVKNGATWEAIQPATIYKVVTNNFTRNGGDGYTWFRDNAINPYDFGPALHEAVIDYFGAFSPVTPVLEGRIAQSP